MPNICELCGKDCTGKKYDKHHIDYTKDITIGLCFGCHNFMHGRPVFYNYWTSTFGKDHGFYELAKKYLQVYGDKMK